MSMTFTLYQINLDRGKNRVAFFGLDALNKYQGTEKVDASIYDKVSEGVDEPWHPGRVAYLAQW